MTAPDFPPCAGIPGCYICARCGQEGWLQRKDYDRRTTFLLDGIRRTESALRG